MLSYEKKNVFKSGSDVVLCLNLMYLHIFYSKSISELAYSTDRQWAAWSSHIWHFYCAACNITGIILAHGWWWSWSWTTNIVMNSNHSGHPGPSRRTFSRGVVPRVPRIRPRLYSHNNSHNNLNNLNNNGHGSSQMHSHLHHDNNYSQRNNNNFDSDGCYSHG